jgi:hypothetical protein
MPGDYHIRHVHSADLPQVIRLQRHLWGDDLDTNLSYFRWKFEDNPYAERPLGIVALHHGNAVGFRGFTASTWNLPGGDGQLRVLGPGDSVVHPDHRLRGLFGAMGEFATREYEPAYDVFLNTSASKNSAPGYVKTGFVPLTTKRYLIRYHTVTLAASYIISRFSTRPIEDRLEYSEHDGFIVSPAPKPEDMSAVVAAAPCDPKRIVLLKDTEFFNWKYKNKRDNFHYYYYRDADAVRGYMVVRPFSRLRRGIIYDYAASEERILARLLQFIIQCRRYHVLMMLDVLPENGIREIVRRMKFTSSTMLGKIEKRINGEWPIFVRPIVARPREKDWFFRGLDIRRVQNWEIKEVCSD